jgi:hypothetical protein
MTEELIEKLTLRSLTDLVVSNCEDVLLKLKERIEGLAEGDVKYSAGGWKDGETPYVMFSVADRVRFPARSMRAMSQVLWNDVSRYRENFAGPVSLTWRVAPEIELDGDVVFVRLRLAFEPVTVTIDD